MSAWRLTDIQNRRLHVPRRSASSHPVALNYCFVLSGLKGASTPPLIDLQA